MDVALLVAGYLVAVPLVARLRSTLRERSLGRFVALEIATALVVAGWALRGAALGVVLNVGFLAAFAAAAWWSWRPGFSGKREGTSGAWEPWLTTSKSTRRPSRPTPGGAA